MDFITFLREFGANTHFLLHYSSMCFRADRYSALFFSYVFEYAKRKQLLKCFLDTERVSAQEAKITLETLFLGQKVWYWLNDITSLDAQAKSSWITYLASYTGPHTLSFFLSSQTTLPAHPSLLIIDVPSTITASVFQEMLSLFYADFGQEISFIRKLFADQERIPLDRAFLLMHYHCCLGKKNEQFFDQWLRKLIVADKSFFTLSQYLFAQQPRAFYPYWAACSSDYPPEYWITFWSEQVWQATLFLQKAQVFGIAEAKKATNRLPFTYMNKDWQLYSYPFLAQAHASLYELDYNLKNGISSYGLELWYHKFFLKKFAEIA